MSVVMKAIHFQKHFSYDETMSIILMIFIDEIIVPWINVDYDGLKTDILKILSEDKVQINIKSYQNDIVTFKNKHNVTTLLIHPDNI